MSSVPGALYSGVSEANALKMKLRADQQIFEMNKRVGEYKEKDAIERGKEEEQKFRKDVKAVIGAQRSITGASNIEIGSGSALDVEQDTAAIGEADALTIRQNARMEAFGYKLEGIGLRGGHNMAQASLRMQRRNTQAQLMITGIQGAGEIASAVFTGGASAAIPKGR